MRGAGENLRSIARIVPVWAAVFLIVMAVLIDSPGLFYMASAMIFLILACRLQAYLAVRALRIERISPPAVHVGEIATVLLTIWSERRLKRPLIMIEDALPDRLRTIDRTPSFPIAPSYDQPIQTRFSFRPMRRGRYSWSITKVIGTDALGLVTMEKVYKTKPAELIVYPARLPVHLPIRPASGPGGISEIQEGKFRGSGIEPRGIREYAPGDPQRHVHWISSARSKNLMVKEFESGAALTAMFVPQMTRGTEIGTDMTTFEAMCGHMVYLAEEFLKLGASVTFPTTDQETTPHPHPVARLRQINELLTEIQPDHEDSLTKQLLRHGPYLPDGGSLFLFLAVQDPDLPGVLAKMRQYEITALVYDLRDYSTARLRAANAAENDYLDQLRAANVRPLIMPKVGEL